MNDSILSWIILVIGFGYLLFKLLEAMPKDMKKEDVYLKNIVTTNDIRVKSLNNKKYY